jgi:hypothetical protein
MIRHLHLYALITPGLALTFPAPRVDAEGLSDASRLGAFSGAMQHCADQHGGADRRYQRAGSRVAFEVSDMDVSDRCKAIAARDRARDRGKVRAWTGRWA